MAIYFNAASIHIIETHQKFDQRCLSSSSWSYDRNFLTFFDIDGEVIDDRLIFVVSEVYMFKCYISSKCIDWRSADAAVVCILLPTCANCVIGWLKFLTYCKNDWI